MAETKRRKMHCLKGQKLSVVVDEALDDILVVTLEIDSRTFKGILFDLKNRNFPDGLSWPFNGAGTDMSSELSINESEPHSTQTHCEISATTLRHTYQQKTNLSANNSTISYPISLSRHFNRDKSARNIRLRPRQTLCSNCKSKCTETEKGIVPVLPSVKHSKLSDSSSGVNDHKDLKVALRKRPAQSEQYINKPCDRPSRTMLPSRTLNTRLTRSNSSVGLNNSLDKNSSYDYKSSSASATSTSSTGTKASPLIKISIGERTVLKIPPRAHSDEVDGNVAKVKLKVEQANEKNNGYTEDVEYPAYKKAKKSIKREKERYETENSNDSSKVHYTVVTNHHKKHKRKHKHRHLSQLNQPSNNVNNNKEKDILDMCNENSVQDESSHADNSEMVQPVSAPQRPRLLYTWRQNKGLSPRHKCFSPMHDPSRGVSPRHFGNFGVGVKTLSLSPQRRTVALSPQRGHMSPRKNMSPKRRPYLSPQQSVKSEDNVYPQRKEYRLRSRERNSTDSRESVTIDTESSMSYEEDSDIAMSDRPSISRSVGNSEDDQSARSEESSDVESSRDGPPGDSNVDLRPLMLKIPHQEHISKCVGPDGKTIHVGDIVWGKIKGFPWWPGRVLSINVTHHNNGLVARQLAHVSWFGSSTMSHIQCSDLFPFLEHFKMRYNRKKRGPYKVAIKQATIAAQSITNTHHIDFTEYDL